MAYQYDFLSDNFTRYLNVENPSVSGTYLEFPLEDNPIDISSNGFSGIKNGIPIAENQFESKLKINNNPEAPINLPSVQTSLQNTNLKGRLKQAMEFFLSKGLSIHAAAGIVGNLILESGLDTTIKGDSGKAFGLALWHPDRQKGLKALARSRGKDISDFETQLEYVWQELNSSHKSALNGLLNSNNVEQATTAFMKHFEKPGKPHLEKRINYAKSLVL